MERAKQIIFFATVSVSIFIVFIISVIINNYSQGALTNEMATNTLYIKSSPFFISLKELLIDIELVFIFVLTVGIFHMLINRIKA